MAASAADVSACRDISSKISSGKTSKILPGRAVVGLIGSWAALSVIVAATVAHSLRHCLLVETGRMFQGCQIGRKSANLAIFKPLPPVGAGGGYMFSGRPCVRPSVIHVVVLCFRDISSIC